MEDKLDSPFQLPPLAVDDMFAEAWSTDASRKITPASANGNAPAPSSSSSSSAATAAVATGGHDDATATLYCPPLRERPVQTQKMRHKQIFYGDTSLYVFLRHYQVVYERLAKAGEICVLRAGNLPEGQRRFLHLVNDCSRFLYASGDGGAAATDAATAFDSTCEQVGEFLFLV